MAVKRSKTQQRGSQEWQRDDNPFSSAGRPVREMSQRSSAGKPVRGIQNQLTRTKLDHHNLQVSDNLYTLRKSSRMFDKS